MSDDEDTQFVFNEEDHQVSPPRKKEKKGSLAPLHLSARVISAHAVIGRLCLRPR